MSISRQVCLSRATYPSALARVPTSRDSKYTSNRFIPLSAFKILLPLCDRSTPRNFYRGRHRYDVPHVSRLFLSARSERTPGVKVNSDLDMSRNGKRKKRGQDRGRTREKRNGLALCRATTKIEIKKNRWKVFRCVCDKYATARINRYPKPREV